MLKRVLLTIIILLAAHIFLPQKTLAQGTFTCRYDRSCPSPTSCTYRCTVANDACQFGYQPNANFCSQFNASEASCISAVGQCIALPATCSGQGGTCRRGGCNLNEDDRGELDCGTTWQCCVVTLPPGCAVSGYACGSPPNCCPGLNCVNNTCAPPGSSSAPPESPLGQGGCGPDKLYTAIGCIPISTPNSFLGFILPWAIGIAGGIAFLLIIYAGFLIMSSSGDPHRLQAGKELLTAAIGGLLLLVLAAFILRVIGVQLFGIPGL